MNKPGTLIAALIALALTVGGCTYTVLDPTDGSVMAKCHDGKYTSFCVVKKGATDAVVTGAGMAPTFNGASGMAAEGVAIGTLLAK